MENNIQIFAHEQFGKVRVIMIDGEPWFVAADVCRVLDFKNPSDILKRLDDDEKCKIPESRVVVDPILNIGPTVAPFLHEISVVNEPGLYRLIFASRKPEAKNFQRWVYHEVLPSIRKTGSYSLVAKPEPVVTFPEAIYRVYAFLLEDTNVKIGYTKRFCPRIGEIKRETHLPIVKIYFTPFMTCENARLVERCCKEIFYSQRVKGEIFSVAFKEACAAIDYFVKLAAFKPLVTKHYIATEKSFVDKNSL